MAADEGFDDDGPEFRPPLPPEDRIWRHPAEVAAAVAAAEPAPRGRSPWTFGLVAVLGGVLIAGSLMFAAGGTGDEPRRIALRPIATLAPVRGGDTVREVADFDIPPAPPSLVGIDVDAGGEVRIGNGLVVEAPGFVVTTAALVADAAAIRVTDADGVVRAGLVVGVDALDDVAVVHVPDLASPVATIDRSTRAQTGQPGSVIGAARGIAISTRAALVASADARLQDGGCDLHGALRLDATLDVSSAGAPFVTADGTVLGIVTTREPDQPAIVVPARTVAWAAHEIIAAGHVRHGWLGIEGTTSDGGGALVQRVVEGSPAEQAGLVPGDVVTQIADEQVATMGALVVSVREHAPGSGITIGAQREGAPVELSVVLGETPTTA